MSTTLIRSRNIRLRSLLAGLTATALLALSACGSTESATPSPTSDGTNTTSEPTNGERETITITDELGREVELQVPIQKVYPNYFYEAEIVRAIGAGDTIVAVDDTTHPSTAGSNTEYFGQFADLPLTGDVQQPDWETIANSGAEVFFAMRNSPWEDAITKLEPFGIKVVVFTGWDPEVLREHLPTIGTIFGKEEGAAKLAELYDDIEVELATGLAKVEKKKTIYFENNADFTTSTPGSGWHDVIVKGGAENLFADINAGSDQGASVHSYVIDPVAAIERNPDYIFRVGSNGLQYGYDAWPKEAHRSQAQAIADRPGWANTTAVQNGDVYTFNNFFYSALGKQIGAIAIASWLYPEHFSHVNVDDYFARWLEIQGVNARPSTDYYYRLGD